MNYRLFLKQKLSMGYYDKRQKRTLAAFAVVFAALAIGMAIGGYVSYLNFEMDYRLHAEQEISAIAELKMSEISNWRNERLNDAETLYQNPAFSSLVERYFKDPNDAEAEAQILAWMKKYEVYDQYENTRLLDASGGEKISIPDTNQSVDARLTIDVFNNLRYGKVDLLDFQRDASGYGEIHISILIPVFSNEDKTRLLGVLALRVNPRKYLFPYLNQWPISSRTAETLLVRREGDRVLFLNEPRFKPDAALSFTVPLTDTDMPAVKAALGQTGIVEGVDYRGEPVLADVRAVPDSPWFLVTKMDIAEVYEPLETRMWETFAMTLMGICITGTALALVWRQQRVVYYRAQAKAAVELRESEEKVRRLNAELEQRVRERTAQLEAINRELESFSYSVSHDLRAPLRGIANWSQALLEDYAPQLDDQARKYIGHVRTGTQHMEDLIKDMLDLARVTQAGMQQDVVDLSAIVYSIAERLKMGEPHRQADFVIQDNLIAKGD
ncbi:MAG: hypothetical protein HYZ23_10280, partial [Chloroflexi bacterium]|nr:hypothetical protein [Chloroflexota bacterium]